MQLSLLYSKITKDYTGTASWSVHTKELYSLSLFVSIVPSLSLSSDVQHLS